MDSFFNSKNIIDILIKWKLHLIIVVVLTVLLTIFISSPIFITPLYKSDAVVYPSNISPYSDENETEQMVQIFQSRDIRDSVVRKFDLARHWKIDSNYKFFASTLNWEYSRKVRVGKTPYEAVEIEVWDPDPMMACNIVNALLDYYNIKVRKMHREKFNEVVDNYRYITEVKKKELDSLALRAKELGVNYGLLDFPNQTREVMRAILGSGGGAVRMQEAQKMKKNLEEKGGERELLSGLMIAVSKDYSTLKLDFDRALLDANRHYTYVNLLSKPYPADKKAYPIRWLIVVVSSLAVFFLSALIIGFIENRKYRFTPRVQE